MEYQEFREQYIAQHPSSVPKKPQVYLTGRANRWLWLLVFGASAYVSGVHTVPVIAMTIDSRQVATLVAMGASLAGFVMVEGLIFLSARHRSKGIIALVTLILSVTVAIAANVYSANAAVTLSAVGYDVPVELGTLAATIIGIIAPLIAMFSGEMFTRLERYDFNQNLEAEKEYTKAQRKFDTDIRKEWDAYQIKVAEKEAQTLAALSAASVRPDTDSRQTRPVSYGYVSTPDGQIKVMAYLDDNPDAVTMGSRALAALIGVSHDTANKGRNAWAAKQNGHGVSSNGNRE